MASDRPAVRSTPIRPVCASGGPEHSLRDPVWPAESAHALRWVASGGWLHPLKKKSGGWLHVHRDSWISKLQMRISTKPTI